MKVRHVDWYPDEWLAGTYELGNAERGLYITVCSLIYSAGGSINITRLHAACRDHGNSLNRQLKALLAAGKLSINGQEITNKRCANELEKAEKRTVNARQNGGKGGRPTNENKDIAKPDGLQSEKLTRAELPTTNHQPSEEKKDSRASAVADGDFEVWWKEVPRKIGKGQARKAHRSALKKAGSDVLIAGIKAYAESRAGEDERYTAHPATWLNGERWLDSQPSAEHLRSEEPDDRLMWKSRVRGWVLSGFWSPNFGARPDQPGCDAPADLIAEAIEQRKARAAA